MDATVLTLTFTALMGVLLLAVGVVHSSIHWAWKVLLILAGASTVVVSFFVYENARGYQLRADHPPARFIFAGGLVREPLPSKQDPGAIYLMVVEKGETLPRTFALPYSKEGHKKVLKANKDNADGKTVFMETRSEADARDGKGKGRGGSGGKGQQSNGRGNGRAGNLTGGAGPGGDSLNGAAAIGDFDFVPPPSTVPDKDSLVGE